MADTDKLKSVDELLDEAKDGAAKGKLAESVSAALAPVKDKKEAAVKIYTEQKEVLLVKRWNDQKKALVGIWQDISCAYGDEWIGLINDAVCPTTEAIASKKAEIEALKYKEGELEGKVSAAKRKVGGDKQALEAWLDADARLTKRLADIEAAITELRAAFANPKERVTSLYLFWWKAWPLLWSIAPTLSSGAFDDLQIATTARPRCALPVLGRDVVHLIPATQYPGEIDAAAQKYVEALTDLKAAQDAFAAAPDDLASAEKTLADLTKNQDQTIKDQLKKHGGPGAAVPTAA